VRIALVLALGLAGCGERHVPDPPYPAVAAPCTPVRIGRVRVLGGSLADVPGLAVLEGTIDDRARLERVLAAATEALHHRGHARARLELVRRPGCFTELDVIVQLGPRFLIERIDLVSGALAVDAGARASGLSREDQLAVLEDALGTANTIGGVYIPYRLTRALAQLEQRYRDAGWLDVRIAAPAVRHDERGYVALTITVDAGPRYRIGAIRARGGGAAARAAVLEELRIEPGAWYDGPAIRHGLERARRRLDRRVELETRVQTSRGEIVLEAIVRLAEGATP
jgi:outer membrane protein assembly factor BamA